MELALADTRRDPNDIITDSDRRFTALREQWPGLLVTERAKVSCPSCEGRGIIYFDDNGDDSEQCTYCNGSGRVCRCKN